MWMFGVLFGRKRFSFDNLTHVVLWTNGDAVYNNPSKKSVLKSQFQNPWNQDEKNWFFTHWKKNENEKKHAKATSNWRRNKKNRLNTLSHRLVRGIIRGTIEILHKN